MAILKTKMCEHIISQMSRPHMLRVQYVNKTCLTQNIIKTPIYL